MLAHIKLISVRPNTNTDFWWTTTNPTVVSVRNDVAAVFASNNVSSVLTVSDDALTCTMTYDITQEGQWPDLVNQTKALVPNLAQNRRGYHEANNHTFKLEIISTAGDVIQEVQIVPAP
jgi:hypothetical protein